MGEQPAPRRGDPFEFAAELHARDADVAVHRPPLVVRSAGPRTRGQPGVSSHARKLRVVTEDVELPRGGRVATEHVPLKPDAVHKVSDCRLGAGEVGVGFVVGAAHDLHPTFGDQPAQVGAVLGMGVPVRLEVVHLGQHEFVFGFAASHFQMRVHQLESVGLAGLSGRVLGPDAGVGALRVPPHRVVVEVADHEHRPPGLGDGERERRAAAIGLDLRRPSLADDRMLDGNRHLDQLLPNGPPGSGEGLPGQAVAVDSNRRRLGDPADRYSNHLQRRVRRPGEKLRRLRRVHPHSRTLRPGRAP